MPPPDGAPGAGDPIASIERSLVAIRRRQTRRTIAGDRPARDVWVLDVVDVVEAANGEVAVGDVARRLGIDPSQASRRVARAVDAGAVRRSPSQHDARRAVLELTDTGRALAAEVHAHRRATIADATTGWSPADRTALADLLARLVADLALRRTG